MKTANHFIHLFFPHDSNNQRARVLHPSFLLIFLALFLASQSLLSYAPNIARGILGYAANISPQEVIRLTNQTRIAEGLSPLVENPVLSQAALAKGSDMLNKNYWAHISPDGIEPWAFFSSAGYKYRFAGENLARDFSNPDSAVNAWMSSPSHRDNILSAKYDEVGIAVIEGDLAGVDTTLIIQFFGSPQEASASVPSVSAEAPSATEAGLAIAQSVQSPAPIPTSAAIFSTQRLSQAQSIEGVRAQVLVSPHKITRTISLVLVSILMLVLVVDVIAVSRRRIVRISGRTFAHLSFFGMIFAIILIARAGKIL